MIDAIVYQIPAIIEDGSIVPSYRLRESRPFFSDARLFCFQEPVMDDVRKHFGDHHAYSTEIVPGTPELVEKYARLDRQLKREHGDLAQIKWGNVQRRLLEMYDAFLDEGKLIHDCCSRSSSYMKI